MESKSFRLFNAAIKSEQTRTVYHGTIKQYMKFHNMGDYDEIVKGSPDKIQEKLENWVISQSKQNLKATTIRAKLNAVELYLEMNKKLYHKKILHKLIPSDEHVRGGDVPFTNEDIQLMLKSVSRHRTRAIIHFLASTGSRPGGFSDPPLRMKHLVNMEHGCKAIKIYDESREGFWAFLTPEASKSLEEYFQTRKINGEKITDESPIFAHYPKSNNQVREFLSTQALSQMIRNMLKKAGVQRVKTGNRFDKATIYGFRKRFNTILKLNNDVNSNIAEKLMAHKKGLDGAYLKPTREECFTEFLKAVEQLTISDESRDKIKINTLEKEKSEVEELKSMIYKMGDMAEKQAKNSEEKVLELIKKFPELAKTLNPQFNN